MKHIEAIAQIDYCYWQLDNLYKSISKSRSPIEAMIDKAIGFEKDKMVNNLKEVKKLIKRIIKLKKQIGFDIDKGRDIEFLEKINKLLKKETLNGI